MGIPGLDSAVHGYLVNSIGSLTQNSYQAALHRFLQFLQLDGCTSSPFPLSEDLLCRFVAYLAGNGLCFSSIRVYLSALRFAQISRGLPDPAFSSHCRLEYVLRGIRRSSPTSGRLRRLPITPSILQVLYSAWSESPVSFNRTMLWAACCMGFFGFMRAGEFTCASEADSPQQMLLVGDVSVDSHTSPSFIAVHLRHSKTDMFGRGVCIYLGRVPGHICPVKAILSYLVLRGNRPGPLFVFTDGTPLSRTRLVVAVRGALQSRGVEAGDFSGHSFRIGAATAAAEVGLEDSLIQTLGRWKSDAFRRYIRTSRETLISVSAQLVSEHSKQ